MRLRPPLLCLALVCGLLPAVAAAQATVAQAAEDAPSPSCIEVEVDGEKAPSAPSAPSFACLTQRLQASAAPARPANPTLASESMTQRPGNQLGVFNRAATSNRMGNTFGTSVYPQRPPPVAPTGPVLPAPK